MNFTRQTRLVYTGRIDEGYLVLSAYPQEIFKPKTLEFPAGVEVALDGQWVTFTESAPPLALPRWDTVGVGSPVSLHIRNRIGHAIDGRVVMGGLTPKGGGRAKIIGQFRLYVEATPSMN
jgi:hypothetical protein